MATYYDATAWTGRVADIALRGRLSRREVSLIYYRMPYDTKEGAMYPAFGFLFGEDFMRCYRRGLRLFWGFDSWVFLKNLANAHFNQLPFRQ